MNYSEIQNDNKGKCKSIELSDFLKIIENECQNLEWSDVNIDANLALIIESLKELTDENVLLHSSFSELDFEWNKSRRNSSTALLSKSIDTSLISSSRNSAFATSENKNNNAKYINSNLSQPIKGMKRKKQNFHNSPMFERLKKAYLTGINPIKKINYGDEANRSAKKINKNCLYLISVINKTKLPQEIKQKLLLKISNSDKIKHVNYNDKHNLKYAECEMMTDDSFENDIVDVFVFDIDFIDYENTKCCFEENRAKENCVKVIDFETLSNSISILDRSENEHSNFNSYIKFQIDSNLNMNQSNKSEKVKYQVKELNKAMKSVFKGHKTLLLNYLNDGKNEDNQRCQVFVCLPTLLDKYGKKISRIFKGKVHKLDCSLIESKFIGEIFYQLEQRIFYFIFGIKPLQRRNIFHGYQALDVKATLFTLKTQLEQEKKVMNYIQRYEFLMKSLYEVGYEENSYSNITSLMIMKYGLFPTLPLDFQIYIHQYSEIELFFHMIVSKVDDKEKTYVKVLFTCLLLMAFYDKQPLIKWE